LTVSSCVQVGLVVGKLRASSDRTLIYSLLPTPPTDGVNLLAPFRSPPRKLSRPSPRGEGKGFDVNHFRGSNLFRRAADAPV
jgi:hypothetical protein